MGRVICIAGSHAVGKTSLFEYFKKNYSDIDVIDGFILDKGKLDLKKEADYIKYELLYIDKLKEMYSKIRSSSKDCIIIRSYEDTLFYLYNQANVKPDWDLSLISNMITDKSDLIIFLDASLETLRQRALVDNNRDLADTTNWYDSWHAKYVSFWKESFNCEIVNTDQRSVAEISKDVKKIIEGR